MAGEHIEDLRIDLKEMDNETLEKKCNFLPSNQNRQTHESSIAKAVGTETAK